MRDALITVAVLRGVSMQVKEAPLDRRDAMDTARQSRNRKGYNPLASRDLGNSSQAANNLDYCSAKTLRGKDTKGMEMGRGRQA